MNSKSKSTWTRLIALGVLIAVAYFGNVALQTHLGEKALAEVELEKNSLQTALAKASASGKPVLADLSAIWCPSCRALDKNVFTDATVAQKIQNDYVFARIEYESEEGEAFMERYQVRGFPTLLVLSPSGEKLKQLAITTDPSDFLTQL